MVLVYNEEEITHVFRYKQKEWTSSKSLVLIFKDHWILAFPFVQHSAKLRSHEKVNEHPSSLIRRTIIPLRN